MLYFPLHLLEYIPWNFFVFLTLVLLLFLTQSKNVNSIAKRGIEKNVVVFEKKRRKSIRIYKILKNNIKILEGKDPLHNTLLLILNCSWLLKEILLLVFPSFIRLRTICVVN